MTTELSGIVREIVQAESATSAEIRVHLTRSWLDRDSGRSASRVFARYGMERTARRNAVLFYVNLRSRRFAIVADDGLADAVAPGYWQELSASLRDDLLSTRYENALAIAIRTIGVTLAEKFPREIR